MGSAVLKLNRWDNTEFLHNQLDKNQCSHYKVWRNWIEEYLLSNGIYDLNDITEQDVLQYREYVSESDVITVSQKKSYQRLLESFVWGNAVNDAPELYDKVMKDSQMEKDVRNKVGAYMMLQGIADTDLIDYELRDRFELFLNKTGTVYEYKKRYIKGLDKLKYEAIRRKNALRPFEKSKLVYEGKILYLGYHPDYETAMSLYRVYEQEWKVYDLTKASNTLRSQILNILNWIIQDERLKKARYDLYLLPLNLFYRYCLEHSLEDVEVLEETHLLEIFFPQEGRRAFFVTAAGFGAGQRKGEGHIVRFFLPVDLSDEEIQGAVVQHLVIPAHCGQAGITRC